MLSLSNIIALGLASRVAQAKPVAADLAAESGGAPSLPYNLYPTVVSQYDVNTGAVAYNTGRGEIFKDPANPNQITTLLTYQIPDWATGMNCTTRFTLANSANTVNTGTRQFDVFRSLNTPAPGQQYNGRDWHVGRWQLSSNNPPGQATILFTTRGEWLPCPPGGFILGVELAGVGDEDDIEWDQQAGLNGPFVAIDRL